MALPSKYPGDWRDVYLAPLGGAHRSILAQVLQEAVYSSRSAEDFQSHSALLKAIRMRMRAPDGVALGVDDMHCFKSGDVVFVFVVAAGEATIIKDEWPLFPSDQLITQLRLITR